MIDGRKAARSRTLKGARIVFNDGASAIDCAIRDISDTGARLRVASPVGIPERFTLVIVESGVRHRSRVVRQGAREIGVAFE